MKFNQKFHLLLLYFAVVPSVVNADPLTYKVKGETVTIVGCDKSASGELAIPTKYKGKPVASIKDNAFLNCISLTGVTIGNSVTGIGTKAFRGCYSLTNVTIPESVTIIGDYAFDGCSSLKSVTIPDSVTSIGRGTFESCSSLTNVTIPKSVTIIGDYAFLNCLSLTGVTIPNSVTGIGDGAFITCSSLRSVAIPDSVTSIGASPFRNCKSLTSIEVGKGNPQYSSKNGVLFNKNKTALIQFPNAKSSDYIIPDSVTRIKDGAFSSCLGLTSVTIPDSVTTIESWAFAACSSLKSITFQGNAPSSFGFNVFNKLPTKATITVISGVSGFGETFGGLPVRFILF